MNLVGYPRIFVLSQVVFVKLLLEVNLLLSLIRHDCLVTRLPVSRANFAIFVGKLERLDEAERLVDTTTDSIVIDLHGAKLAISIDDEDATEGCSVHWVLRILDEHIVVARHLLADVSEQWVANVAQTSLCARCVHPRQVSEVRVG